MDYAFEWDEAKRAANLAKHGIDFAEVARFEWAGAAVMADTRQNYAEPRFIGYGWLDDLFYAVVFTDRGAVRRIISFRRANRREQAAYHSRIP